MQLNVQTFPKNVLEFAVGLPMYALPVRRDCRSRFGGGTLPAGLKEVKEVLSGFFCSIDFQ